MTTVDAWTGWSPRSTSRNAGALYLVIILFGVGSELLRSSLIEPMDAGQTAANILAAPELLRFSLVADSIMALCDVALAILLFVLLRPVSMPLACLAAAFRLVQSAVLGGNLLNQQAALLLLDREPALSGLDLEQVAALAQIALEKHSHGYDLGLLFFGVNCLLLGVLIVRSGYIPRLLGLGLLAAGIVYLAGGYLLLLAPLAAESFTLAYVVPLVAESAFCLWLLLRGVNGQQARQSATSSA